MTLLLSMLLLACESPGPTTETADTGDTASADTGTSDSGDPADTGAPPARPAFYPAGRVHSPIGAFTAAAMRDIAAVDPSLNDDVFAKAGASSTVSTRTLHCFAGDSVVLGDHTDLRASLDFFLGGDAAGTTPFDRETLAARSGHSAGWVIDGPLQSELEALSPRFVIVHYGTNDMGLYGGYSSSMDPLYENMEALIDLATSRGVVPIVTGISPRLDRPDTADLWVHTYNAILRGIAQAHQVPFIDLQHATRDLDDFGLSGDGLHLAAYPGGACVLTDEGLEWGYNVRNLIALQAFDRAKAAVVDGVESLDDSVAIEGEGSPDAPWVVPELPFTHAADTGTSPHRQLDVYDCDDADESGPEFYYTVQLTEPTALRAIVLDHEGVDIDVHVLDASGSCLDRAHRVFDTTLAPGSYTFVLDTWTNDGDEQSGTYQFVLAECDPRDAGCG